jgi:ribosomal-protein-alanine N-acetyltransferase
MMPPDWRPPTLTTPRLHLRPFTEADAEPLFEHARNPNVTRFTLWDAHKTADDTRSFIRDYALIRYREGLADPYAITVHPDPRPIGACGCFWASQPHRTMEIGYWIAEPFWGQGIAVEACRPLIRVAFRDFETERLQARVIAGNTASSRVLEKLGFRFEGALRAALLRRGVFEDVLFYSLLRQEWQAAQMPEPTSA